MVLDLYSRKVIGWSMKPSLAKDIFLDALLMAIWQRRPNESVIIHSLAQQCCSGSQYGSRDWQKHNLIPSMSRRGLAQYTAHGIMLQQNDYLEVSRLSGFLN